MTRRGSLAYYSGAWVCGCVFMSLAVWLSRDWDSARYGSFKNAWGLLVFSYFGLLEGASTAILFAFLLRRLSGWFGTRKLWQWLLFGALLAELLIWGLATAYRAMPISWLAGRASSAIGFFFAGPQTVFSVSRWLPIPVGAATAFVLFHINRRFEALLQPQETASMQ